MRNAAIFIALLSIAPAVRAGDAPKPNFTGTWKMNAAKSDFGQLPRPSDYERSIDHKEPLIQMTVRQASPAGEQTLQALIRTDGQEITNTYASGESKTTARWSGNELEVTTTRHVQQGDAVTRDTWSLSPDGKSITVLTRMNTPRGTFNIKLVLDRQ